LYLSKRNGVYQFRKPIPQDLSAFFGSRRYNRADASYTKHHEDVVIDAADEISERKKEERWV
jgi:hypothetical protein